MQISTSIDQATALLLTGELIGIPTETVYGLAARMDNEKAIKRIFEVKNRPQTNPLIIHCHSIDQIKEYCTEFPAPLEKIANHFWPGPLTVLLPKKNIPDYITAGQQLAAFRIPNHPLTLALLKQLPTPLVAPSANPSNRISPTNTMHVANYFAGKIPLVLDGGECSKGIESTIIGSTEQGILIYRPGTITAAELAEQSGIQVQFVHEKKDQIQVPGTSKLHYSPTTPLFLIEEKQSIPIETTGKIGLITFGETTNHQGYTHFETLSHTRNLGEAAANLYAALHRMDSYSLDKIYCQLLPNEGIGIALNNRLLRAGKKI